MPATLEETVAAEQAAHEQEAAADAATHDPPDDPDGKALFDRDAYQRPELRIDQVDGEEVDKLWIPVTGRVPLDRTNPEHVALFKRLRLGQDVELRVSARCVKVGTGFTTSKDGDLDAVVGERTLKVTDVWAIAPEEL